MSDWDYGFDSSASTDPYGMDSWNNYGFDDNPNIGGNTYDLGGWDGGFGLDQISSDYMFNDLGDMYSGSMGLDPSYPLNQFQSNPNMSPTPYFEPSRLSQQLQLPQGNPMPQGVDQMIKSLLNNPDKWMGGLSKLFAASEEKDSNKDLAKQLASIAQKPVFDPFGSQRPFYQQQLQQSVTNPYASPMVASQVQGIADAQARKDAAAGRRSNAVGSAPQVLAAQAGVAQNYMNSLMGPAGAGINPAASALAQLYTGSAQAGAQGNSPYFSALGSITQQNTTDRQMQELLAALKNGG
jgi:hypothetical protein